MMANAWNYSFTGDYPTKLNALLVYYQVKADDSTSIDKGKLAKAKKGMTKKAFTTFKEQAEHGRKIYLAGYQLERKKCPHNKRHILLPNTVLAWKRDGGFIYCLTNIKLTQA